MIFETLIKPKWQHHNPKIRQLAIETLDEPEILSEMAQNDEEASVRQAALEKIHDFELLKKIVHAEQNQVVKETASLRLKRLLCGLEENAPELATRLKMLEQITDTQLLTEIAQQGAEVELRFAAIHKINPDETLLANIATHDANSEIRLFAVEKINEETLLKQVFKEVRNRDKRVSRRAREKLDQLIEQQERPKRIRQECQELCTRIEALQRRLTDEHSPFNLNNVTDKIKKPSEHLELKRLQERWQTIAAETEPEFQTRFTKAQQAIYLVFNNYQQAFELAQQRESSLAPLRAEKQTLCEQIEALLTELKNRQRLENEEEFNQRLNTIIADWGQLPSLDEHEENSWQVRFEHLRQTIYQQQQDLQEKHQKVSELETICTTGENWVANNSVLKADDLVNLQSRWQANFPTDSSLELFNQLNKRFNNLQQSLEQRLQEQKELREKAAKEIKKLLEQLETILEKGELKTAIPLEKETNQWFQELNQCSPSRHKALEKRFQACVAKIAQLRGWQQWGNKLEREKLCTQIEELETTDFDNPDELLQLAEELQTAWKRLGPIGYSPELRERFYQASNRIYQNYREILSIQMENLWEQQIHPEEAARKIRQAQDTWKTLGSQGHNQELWERFNQACQNAYEPCKTYFNIQSQERERNFYEKQAICEKLEAYAVNTDWKNINEKEVQAFWKKVYNFVWEQEKAWRNIGATDRKLRKGIQRRFQAAMQVLETYMNDERQNNCHNRLKLIGEVEQIAEKLQTFITQQTSQSPESQETAPGERKSQIETAINQAIEQVKKIQEQWQVTIPNSRQVEREFWKTFRSACDVVFDYRKQQQEALKKQFQNYLESKTSLCGQVEALAQLEGESIKTAPAQVKKLQEEWKKIKLETHQIGNNLRKKAKDTEAVEDRFKKACELVTQCYQEQLAFEYRHQMALLKLKALFCVELEQTNSLAQIECQENSQHLELIQPAWELLPELEDKQLDAGITQRFQQASTALSTGKFTPNAKTITEKETLCIRLEILTGIESPPEASQARLAYQVNRLSNAMRGVEKKHLDKQKEAQEIERLWYLTPAPGEQAQSLEQRFQRAWQAFEAS